MESIRSTSPQDRGYLKGESAFDTPLLVYFCQYSGSTTATLGESKKSLFWTTTKKRDIKPGVTLVRVLKVIFFPCREAKRDLETMRSPVFPSAL